MVVRVRVPDWVDESRVEEQVHRLTEEIVSSTEQSADEARRFFEVDEVVEEIMVSSSLGSQILKTRRKRVW